MKIRFLSLIILSFLFSNLKAETPNLLKLKSEDFNSEIEYHDLDNNPLLQRAYDIVDSMNIGTKKASFNGSIIVGYQGKILYQNSFGVADKSTQIENTVTTPTQLASITKTFTGSVILKLQEEGLLNIYDPVKNYILEFPYLNITIEQLLSHRSGLPDYLGFSGKYWKQSDAMYNEDVLNMFVEKSFPLNFAPGSRFKYCNSNYAILGIIIERVTNKSFKDFLEDDLFEPLNMEKSYVFDPVEGELYESAKSYKQNFVTWKNTHQDGVYADKGIFSSALDLYRWDLALKSEKFLPLDAQKDAYTPRSPLHIKKNYGLGWRIKRYPNGEQYVYHTGWWHGYQGIFSRYLEDDFTIIILSNRFTKGISANAEKMYATLQPLLGMTELM